MGVKKGGHIGPPLRDFMMKEIAWIAEVGDPQVAPYNNVLVASVNDLKILSLALRAAVFHLDGGIIRRGV